MPSAGGSIFISRRIGSGNGRAAASCVCRSPSSARFGRRQCHSRWHVSSKVAWRARSWMSCPQYARSPRSPSRKQIREVVATTSSRPPFGFSAVAISRRSYPSVYPPEGGHHGLYVVSGFSRITAAVSPEGGHHGLYVVSGFSRITAAVSPEGGHHGLYVVSGFSRITAAVSSLSGLSVAPAALRSPSRAGRRGP